MHPVTVTWDGGVRFTARVRGHTVQVDQPLSAGGEDTAIAPIELIPASLGTCIAYFVQQFLVSRGLSAAGLTVTVNAEGAKNPHRIGSLEAKVAIPGGVPERYAEAVQRAASTCTAHNTLRNPPAIAIRIEAPLLKDAD
ncbi:MAG TPA: OsmC family protein [Gemmatimonadales bacterium]|nr:OsmC family protein [Gemmatimonadales bacterium]